MGIHHCWQILRRILYVALACASVVPYCVIPSAFSAESTLGHAENTSVAVKTGGEPLIVSADLYFEESEPFFLPVFSEADIVSDLHVTTEQNAPTTQKTYDRSQSALGRSLNDPALTDIEPAGGGVFEEHPSFLPPKSLLSGPNTVRTALGEVELVSDEEFELIFSVNRQGRRRLSNTSVGLQKGLGYYIPVLEVARLTQLNAVPDFENQIISGFFVRENARYEINVRNGTYTFAGETFDLPSGSVIVKDLGRGLGEFYIAIETLNKIWPLALEFNTADLVLDITTQRSLPEDLSAKRQARWEFEQNKPGEEFLDFSGLTYIPNTYKMLTPPALNVSNRTNWRSKNDSLANTTTVRGQHDVFGMQANYNAGFTVRRDESPEFTSARLKLRRQDFGDGALPFGFKLFEAGDISTRPSDLIDKSIVGRGIAFSNRPIRRASTFDEITVEGLAQPGWEVELYNNNRLVAFGTVDDSGEYRFDNVDLGFGGNTLKTVLYGPQGQIEEREENHQISGKMLLPGETQYQISALDTNKALIGVDDRSEGQPTGHTYQARVDQGINRWISGFATFTQTPVNEMIAQSEDRRYVTAGANIAVLGGAAQAEAYKEIGGGQAFDLRYLTRFAGTRLTFRGSKFFDFESEESGFGDRAKDYEAEVRADRSVRFPKVGSLGVSARYLKRAYQDNTSTTDISNTVSLSRNGVRVSNKLDTDLTDNHHRRTSGDISVNARLSPRWQARGRLDYDVFPERSLDVADFELRYRSADSDFTAAFDVSQNLQEDSTRIGANASYDFGTFLGGIDMGWGADQGFNVGVRANTSLGPYGEDGRYIASSSRLTGRHTVKGRIFEDTNGNAVFDDGDVLLEDARFKVGLQRSTLSTADGSAMVERAGPVGPASITVDEESLPDPFLASAIEGYSTIIRPNTKFPTLDFPVLMTGTIDGKVYFEDGTPVPGLIIQLMDDQGQVVQETTTQFDGFYIFEYVKPGSYQVVVSASHQVSVPSRSVRISSDDLFAYGVDLHFKAQATDGVVAAEADGASGRIALYHAPATGGTEKPAPTMSESGFQTTISAVRIGEHPYKVRLVLDLSGQSGYSITSLNDGHVIIIDLPSTAWDAKKEYDLSKNPVFKSFEALSLTDESGVVTGTRLRLVTRDPPVEIFYNNALPPENGHGHRIYADFLTK